MSEFLETVKTMKPRVAIKPPKVKAPLIDTSQSSPSVAVMGDIINNAAAPFQGEPDPNKGALGQAEFYVGMVMGVAGAPFELLDTGFALVTAPLAALMPGLPAATLMAPHLGMPHGHAHPPSLIPPNPVPIPLPSIGTVMCAGCVSVLIGGIPAARAGDVGLAVTCGSLSPAFEVYTGSSNTWIGGSRAARMTDITRHCNPASAMGKLGAIMGAVGLAAGGVSAGATSAAGEALQASMQAAQLAADAIALAMSALLGKDPGIPPALGALLLGNPTVLIGGFPLPDLLDVLGAALKGLKKLGDVAGKSPRVKKALAKVGLCNDPGEPVNSFSGVVYNDFEDYRDSNGFVWERHYRSDWNDDDGPLGYGFRHFYDRRLRLLRKRALYEAHDGEQISIPRADGGGFVPGAGFTLTEQRSGRHVLTTDRDEVLEFDTQPTESPSARLVRYGRKDLQLSLTYDDRGRLQALTEVNGDRVIDTRIARDERGRIVQLHRGLRGGAETTISRYAYENDCLVAWQDALGETARMRYDAARRMVQGTDRRGYSFHWHYDPHTGRCIKAHGDDGLWGIEATYKGGQSVFKEADGGEWTFKHFADGIVSHRLDPEGGLLEYVRDEGERIVVQLMPGDRQLVWFYDDEDRHYGRADQWGNQFAPEDEDPEPDDPFEREGPLTAKHWLWGTTLEQLSNSWGSLTGTIIQELERLGPFSIAEPRAVPEPRRDGMGRPLERVNEGGVVERYQYDAEGNVVATQDCHGHWSRREIGSWNLTVAEQSALGHVTRYEYSHREKLRALVDPAGNRTDYVHDAVQRVREERRGGQLWRSQRHDANDVLVEERDWEGTPLRTVITGEGGKPREVHLSSGEVYRFEYDGRGRPTEASSTEHEITLQHLRELRVADRRDGQGVEHAYESWLGIRRTTYFERFVVEYDYRSGPGVLVLTPDGGEHRIHPGAGRVVARHNANGTSEATVFDEEGRLCTRVCWETDRPYIGATRNERYRYSGAGELELWIDSHYGPTQFEYDADHRLIAARGACGELVYEYDTTGNLVSAPGAEVVEYDAGNRLRHANLSLYLHDEQQRRSQTIHPFGATVRYEYDSRGQIQRASWSDREDAWTAAYDGLGRRLWKQYGAARTDYYWDGDRLAAERFPNGRLRLYVYSNEDALVPFCFLDYADDRADPKTGRAYYLYAAPTGMPLRVEDQDRNTVWQVKALHPYGRIQLEPGAKIDLCLRFAGHYYDEHIELHYNRFRDYDPVLGRYLQPDPIGHEGGSNLYGYPPNPLSDVDLQGLVHRKAKAKAKKKREREVRKQVKKRKQEQAAANKRKAAKRGANAKAKAQTPPGPTEAYDRKKHYGRTPTKADRKAAGAGPNEVLDHDPPLVKRYYEGDPSTGEKPGHQMTPAERRASAKDRSRMSRQPRTESDAQGGTMSKYSKDKKKQHGL